MFTDMSKAQPGSKLAITQGELDSEPKADCLFLQMVAEDQSIIKKAILTKFQSVLQTREPMSLDEMRLTIKLMIHSHKRKADWPQAFAEYTKVTQNSIQLQQSSNLNLSRSFSSLLLHNLRDLLDIMVPDGLSSGDESVLGLLRQTLSSSNNRQFLCLN